MLLLFFSAEAKSRTVLERVLVPQDSLQIDQSQVIPRRFKNLKEKYTDPIFVYERNKSKSGWWSQFKAWLNDLWKRLFDFKDDGQASAVTEWALKIAAIIIALLVVYFIFKAIINDEGRWVFGKSSKKSIIPHSAVENNIYETDFKSLITQAENESNYRLAIRYYYLWLLKQLNQAEIITYDVEKTNSDYQNEISNPEFNKAFSYTSYLYNYIWYGEFEVNTTEFVNAKAAFHKLINSLKV